MGMIVYSAMLASAILLGSPWWLWRMASSARYRAGLSGRLGAVPQALREAVAGRRVIWLHAVSVGEVLAAERLIVALRTVFEAHVIVVSTTTASGQAIAKKKFGDTTTFFLPLDFALAVRSYLQVLQPELLVLMESELWPRLLVECNRRGTQVVIANARVSDRSFPRYMRLRKLWKPLLAKVDLLLAQGEESAGRLRLIGAPAERVRVVGNLKYDSEVEVGSAVVSRLRELVRGRKVVVAGSTLAGEEKMLLDAWAKVVAQEPDAILVLAPRHPQRFREVEAILGVSQFQKIAVNSHKFYESTEVEGGAVFLLDTIGDLAAVYGLAAVAFVGGSLVAKGGHNPLEPARFGVPVVIGKSYENFREIVEGMRAADALRLVDRDQVVPALVDLLVHGAAMGERGQRFFEGQTGATERTVQALLALMAEREG